MTHFLFKERLEDFIVEEILEQDPPGEGDYHYIFIEKKNIATFDLINKLQAEFGFSRNMIGIAGLKDKQGVTRQWLSFLKRDVHKHCGGINNLLTFLRKITKVITATYGYRMLKLGVNKGNRFEVTLRLANKKDHEKLVKRMDGLLKQVEEYGLPNYFGEQRFGHRGNNRKTGEKLILGEIKSLKGDNNTTTEKRFKVQAFASYLFNRYLDLRVQMKQLDTLLPGDVVIPADGRAKHYTGEKIKNTERLIITGPVFGYDLTYAKDAAAKLEEEIMERYKISKKSESAFQRFGLFGIRRALVIYPTNLTWLWTKDKNFIIRFDLTSGAYASVLVDWIEQILEKSA